VTKWFVLATLAGAAACSGGADHVLGPTTYVVDGVWLFEETLADSNFGEYCNDHTRLTVTQDGPRFTAFGRQVGSCSGVVPFTIDSEPLGITDGTIDGTVIRFSIPPCPYAGTAYGTKPDSVAGRIICQFRSNGQTIRLAGSWHIIPPPDRNPPAVSGSRFGGGANGILEAGDDTLLVRIQASDNTALRTVGYELQNYQHQVVHRDSILFGANDVAAVDDTLHFPLPLSYAYQGPTPYGYQATVFARDTASNLTTAAIDSFVVYPPPLPTINGSLSGASGDSIGALTDTLEISVSASAPRALQYIGYRLTNFGSFGDSIAVTDTTAAHVFRLPIPFAWKGLFLTTQLFVRDHLGLANLYGFGNSIRVVVKPSRPTQVLHLNQGVGDLAWDAARSRVYIATARDSGIETGHPEVRIFRVDSPGAGAYEPGILIPEFPNSIDLSPGGDSLISVTNSGRLGFLNLNTATYDSSAPLTGLNGYLFRIRVLANNHALISVATGLWGEGASGQLIDYDLGGASQTIRTDVGTAGAIGPMTLLARAPDRSRLLVYPARPNADAGQLYIAASASFGTLVTIPRLTVGGADLSTNSAGTLWLVGNRLLDNALATVYVLGAQPEPESSVIAYDGTTAYVQVPEGVAKYRLSDGVLVETILLPYPPYRLTITPDGNTLIGVAGGLLYVVDLR